MLVHEFPVFERAAGNLCNGSSQATTCSQRKTPQGSSYDTQGRLEPLRDRRFLSSSRAKWSDDELPVQIFMPAYAFQIS